MNYEWLKHILFICWMLLIFVVGYYTGRVAYKKELKDGQKR